MSTADVSKSNRFDGIDDPEYETLMEQHDEQEPIEDAKNVLQRTMREDDTNRVNAACNLMNTFNYAIQVQADRPKWQPSDYRAFAIALVALDSVGKSPTEVRDTLTPYQAFKPA